jgi:hypothetical protein
MSSPRARSALSLFIAGCLALAGPHAAFAQPRHGSDDHGPIEIGDVVNLAGADLAEPGNVGVLTLGAGEILFTHGKTARAIPFDAIRAFAIEHSNTPLLRGTKGTLAGFAPQVGQLYSAIRPGAETLTLLYADRNHALHYAVLVLPKTRKDDTLRAFADAGLIPSNGPVVALPDFAPPTGRYQAVRAMSQDRPTIRVAIPQADAEHIPAAYLAGIYEDLIAQLAKSGSFAGVWREGDIRADADALTLTVRVTEVRKGSAGVRGALPVVGMIVGKTLIEAEVDLTDPGGTTVMRGHFKGSKRLPGENMAATKSLALRISSALGKRPIRASDGESPHVAGR